MTPLLNTLQLRQKVVQIGPGNNESLNSMFNRIVVLTNVIIDDQLTRAIVVVQAFRNQQRRMGEFVQKSSADIELRNFRGQLFLVFLDFILNALLAKRCGYQNRERNAGPLQRRVYAGHLRPRHHPGAAASGEYHGEYPLRCC